MPFCLKKKCLSSSHETGLAIAVHYTNDVIRVSRASEVCLQLSESSFLWFSAGWRFRSWEDSGEGNWGGLTCHWKKPYNQAGSISVTFNNQRAIRRQLGTQIIHISPSCLASRPSCLKISWESFHQTGKPNTNYINYGSSKKWDTLPFRCPTSLLKMVPFPAVPQSLVHPWGTSGWMHQKAYLTETTHQQVKYTYCTWNKHVRQIPNTAYSRRFKRIKHDILHSYRYQCVISKGNHTTL